nr:hypothetical protein [candidate division Zixibacteria bacterium]
MKNIRDIKGKAVSVRLSINLFFAIILLFAINAQAAYNHVELSSSSLPYTAHSNDSITIAGTKITTAGNGITISGVSNVFVNLGTDTLQFGDGYGDSKVGIEIGSNASNIKIYGGNIRHGGGTGTSDSSWNNVCLRVSSVNTLLIRNTRMEVYGWNGHNIYNPGGNIVNAEIDGGRFIDHVAGFVSRCEMHATSILFGNPSNVPTPPNYNWKIHDLYIDCWHSGIFGGGLLLVYNCTLFVDAKNDLYSYPSDNFCHTSSSSGGISLWKPYAGTKIHHNVVIAGTQNEGCELGFAVSYGSGTAANPIEFYNNKAILHRGQDDYYNGVTTKGLKQRWGNKYIKWYDNEFYVSAHPDSGSHALAWGRACEGIDLIFTSAAYGSEGPSQDSFTVFERNHIEAVALNSSVSAATGIRLTVRNEYDDYDFTSAGNAFRNNYFESSTTGIDLGKGDGGPASTVLFQGDTVATAPITFGYNTFEVGDWGGASKDNIARDVVYLGEASATDIYWDPSSTAAGSDISLEKTLVITVTGSNGAGVDNASVRAINNYGQTAFSTTTNASGVATGVARYLHAFKSISDSTGYNNFKIIAKKGTDSTVISSLQVTAAVSPINMVLDSTEGLPPAVNDLDIESVAGSTITLTWTAPGTAGADSMASLYDIRYSTQKIDLNNWNQATQVSGEPNPAVYGTTQTCNVTGLTGSIYYFGMKARYGTDRWSTLSNIASSDTTPPAAVIISAIPGFGVGEIYLSWLPSEDNDALGVASSYAVRYSVQSFDESGWDEVDVYDDDFVPDNLYNQISLDMSGGGITAGEEYYIAVKARDEAGNLSDISNVVSAIARSDMSLDEGQEIAALSPRNYGVVHSRQPTLVINNIDSESELTYEFEVALDSTFSDIIASGSMSQGDEEVTIWQVPVELDPFETYCWHAVSSMLDSTASNFFMIRPESHAYPNPFNPATDGFCYFTELPENASLLLMTVSGSTVKKWSDISGGEVAWDGTNEDGNMVASATYLWFVENSDIHGKIIVIR